MWKDQYTAEQIALVLMQGALGFEHYMQEVFRLYDLAPDDDSRQSKAPDWAPQAVPERTLPHAVSRTTTIRRLCS